MIGSTEFERMRALLDGQRARAAGDGRPALDARRDALVRLRAALIAGAEDLVEAVAADFGGRSPRETRFLEIAAVTSAIDEARLHLQDWMTPLELPPSPLLGAARAMVVPEPKGVVGIIVPWNYPVGLALGPLVAALAAGNRVMLKPSTATPRTTGVLRRLLAGAFDDHQVAVVSGAPGLGEPFAALPFDHLLFTGSSAVGRAVMRAAADNLVPVTLELGGKCPVVLAPDYPIEDAAVPVAWGKTLSAGQTCVAPDYALVHRGQRDGFVRLLTETLSRFYPTLASNADYSAIISARARTRIRALLADAADRGATLVEINPSGERFGEDSGKMPPTLVLDPTGDMRVMQEEIFGPVLPIVAYDDIDEAIACVNARPRPLALYLFSRDRSTTDTVLARTSSGGVTINGVMSHMLHESLPFGGVGASGMGHYHGRWGFLTFSHLRPIVDHGTARRPADRVTAPYGPFLDRLIETWLRPA